MRGASCIVVAMDEYIDEIRPIRVGRMLRARFGRRVVAATSSPTAFPSRSTSKLLKDAHRSAGDGNNRTLNPTPDRPNYRGDIPHPDPTESAGCRSRRNAGRHHQPNKQGATPVTITTDQPVLELDGGSTYTDPAHRATHPERPVHHRHPTKHLTSPHLVCHRHRRHRPRGSSLRCSSTLTAPTRR